MRLAATRVQFICDWRPLGYNLYATGGHSRTIYMRLAASRVQFICDWPPVVCKLCMPWRPVACKAASFLQARCKNNYLNYKMKMQLKNLRIYVTHVLAKAYPLKLSMA
jgi:hypothetical protein